MPQTLDTSNPGLTENETLRAGVTGQTSRSVTHGGIARDSNASKPAECLPVLHLINGEHYSGAERVQDLLALRLPDYGFEVTFACLKADRFPALRLSQNCRLYRRKMRSGFRLSFHLARKVRRYGFRLIHAHTPRTAVIGALASRWSKVPLIYHVHSPVGRDSTRRFRNRLNGWFENFATASASQLITVSTSLGDYMLNERRCHPSLVSIVPNGVPSPREFVERPRPTGTWTIGTVALFRPRKGTEVLLDALAMLRNDGMDFRLRAVGPFETAEYERSLKDRVK